MITLATLGTVIVTIAALTFWRMRAGRPPRMIKED